MKKLFYIFSLTIIVSGCALIEPTGLSYSSGIDIAPSSTIPTPIERENITPIGDTFILPVLAFHHVGDPPAGMSASQRQWYISVDKFNSILDYLGEHDIRIISTREMLSFLEEGVMPERAVILTFDDGSATFYDHVLPIIIARNVKVEMYMPTRYNSKMWLSRDQIVEIYESGLVDFGVHGMYHEYLTRLSDTELRRVLSTSKNDLEKLLGTDIVSLAYPFGLYDDRVIDMMREAGYSVGYTIIATSTQAVSEPHRMGRYLITEMTNITERLFNISRTARN
jgi:peptidoglycan/xylan/chitin deacetylase (PgdA/CDA1 family)